MPIETGAGSPVGYTSGELGEGSPVAPIDGAETGSGSPVAFIAEPPLLVMTLRQPFASAQEMALYGYDPAYSEDGGTLVEVQASWPVKGPFTVYLRNALDVDLPSGGCYSGISGQGADIYANASQQFIRFAIPKVPRGTYTLVVNWDGGGSTLGNAIRIVPRQVPAFTRRVLFYAGVGPFMEKRTP